MLFTGASDHTIDSKLRLAIPARFRNQLHPNRDGLAWMSVPWPGGVIRLYTERQFERLASQRGMSLTPGEDDAELETNLFGFAERLEADAQGRVTIPKVHMELAPLPSTDVVIVGAGSRLEVRDRGEWQAARSERFAKLSALVARIEARRNQHGGSEGPGKAQR